jgi:DNA-binding transcriptional regulator/RsmH inhibitor MraZ
MVSGWRGAVADQRRHGNPRISDGISGVGGGKPGIRAPAAGIFKTPAGGLVLAAPAGLEIRAKKIFGVLEIFALTAPVNSDELRCTAVHCVSGMASMEFNYDYKMDPKGRVSIPVDWRPAQGEKLRLMIQESYEFPVVVVLTAAEFEERLRTVAEDQELPLVERRQIVGAMHARARSVVLNEQGKLLVPQPVLEACGLRANAAVKLVGRGKYFEIWSPENFAVVEERENVNLKKYNARYGFF